MPDPSPRRSYDSPVRRRQVERTRERIITSGAELLHGFPIWNWGALTVPAVAERAGITERTVYRYFPNERALRDAVMARVEDEVSVELDALRLEDLPSVTARVFEYISSFPFEKRSADDPTLTATHQRQRDGILAAVCEVVPDWPVRQQIVVAAMLDLLWNYASYELLVADWELDPEEAIAGVTWLMGLIDHSIRNDSGPDPL